MEITSVSSALTAVANVINYIKNNITNVYMTKSLSEVTKLTRVEPLTIVSKDLVNLPYIADVNNALCSLFSGYYLQAVNMLTTVNDVEVVRILDRLNPDRDETGWLLGADIANETISHLAVESYLHRLPTKASMALENQDYNKTIENLNTVANLSVGKMLNVEISVPGENDKKKSVNIPINVRLMASLVPNATIQQLLAGRTEDTSLIERFHAWRGGRISFIKDLIFCQDLIDEFKRATIGDETGTIQEIIRRVNNSKKFGLLTKNPSLVSASNLFVISEEAAREVESKLGGKLSNPSVRKKAFDNTYAMIIAVVDREYERVTFYTRGITASTDVSLNELKNATKNKSGIEIMDVLRSLNQGSSVAF